MSQKVGNSLTNWTNVWFSWKSAPWGWLIPIFYPLYIKQDTTDITWFLPKGCLLPTSLFYIEDGMIPINSFLTKLLLSVQYKRQVMAKIRICWWYHQN